jgi:hypothetical protein
MQTALCIRPGNAAGQMSAGQLHPQVENFQRPA